ncbi:unnamed protein product [Phaedon cochleariae]|uniref:Uncharacterized protein n=1 Tax=Phaedon cochleariae TaxID=80249 RepID=A0A9P0GL51_PHACE|nr:unnamed protein product [Phaedon cochleariae]
MFGVGICSSLTMSSSEETLHNIRVNMIKSYFQEKQEMNQITKKVERICPGYGRKFEEALLKVQQCSDAVDDTQQTMCSAVKNHFEICARPVTEIFEECLPESSQDLPSFIIKTMVAMSNHLCRIDGEHIIELSNPCVKSQTYRMRRCMMKAQSKLQTYSSQIPSKQEVCESLRSLKTCFKSHLTLACGNQVTRESFLDLFESGMKLCDEVTPSPSFNEIEVLDLDKKNEWHTRRSIPVEE